MPRMGLPVTILTNIPSLMCEPAHRSRKKKAQCDATNSRACSNRAALVGQREALAIAVKRAQARRR
jgi:hypothetical protein